MIEMGKSNNGSSLPNQGDRKISKGSNTGKAAKQDAKPWKSKSMSNPPVPTELF